MWRESLAVLAWSQSNQWNSCDMKIVWCFPLCACKCWILGGFSFPCAGVNPRVTQPFVTWSCWHLRVFGMTFLAFWLHFWRAENKFVNLAEEKWGNGVWTRSKPLLCRVTGPALSIPSIMLIFVASCITQCLQRTEHAEFPVYRWSY